MKCSYPIILSGRAFGCGQCVSCRVNKRRIWVHRMMLEASQYEHNAFLTLTYTDDALPTDGSLNPSHLRNYFKRLRKAVAPDRVRYLAVGEYGDVSLRPHYHAALFGMRTCERGLSSYTKQRTACCAVCTTHAETWGYGNVYLGELNEKSSAYVVSYVVKSMTKKGDVDLAGRHPEFARMSNRPGIGAGFMDEVASCLMFHRLEEMTDVPNVLRHGRKIMPLGRYLTRRLRTRMGRSPDAPQAVHQAAREELRPLWEAAQASSIPGQKSEAFRQAIIEASLGRTLQAEARERRGRKGSI